MPMNQYFKIYIYVFKFLVFYCAYLLRLLFIKIIKKVVRLFYLVFISFYYFPHSRYCIYIILSIFFLIIFAAGFYHFFRYHSCPHGYQWYSILCPGLRKNTVGFIIWCNNRRDYTGKPKIRQQN